jgi:hypothetical protein
VLEECWILLSIQELDLERQEAKLVEEQAHGLHSLDGRDLSMELDERHMHVAGVEDKHTIGAQELSQLVMVISIVLVDLGTFPIWDIARDSKMA